MSKLDALVGSLTCRLGEGLPEIWLLHGYGSHEGDLFSFESALPQHGIRSLRAPIDLAMGGLAWYDIHWDPDGLKSEHMEQVNDAMAGVVDALKAVNGPPPLLFGFSQGGILANAIAWNHPDLIAGSIAVCSYFPHNWPMVDLSKPPKSKPLFMAVGDHDGVIPASQSLPTYHVLREAIQGQLTVNNYPMAHSIHPTCFRDILSWIALHGLNAKP